MDEEYYSRPAADQHEGFPNFSDGDVHFVMAPGQSYQLHARTLKTYSLRLDKILNSEDAARLDSSARRKGVTTVFRIEFATPQQCRAKGWPSSQWHKQAGGLRLRQIDQRGRPTGSTATTIDGALDAGLEINKLFSHWDNVLRAMHQTPMEFDKTATDSTTGAIDLTSLVDDICGICAVADYLNCMRVVTHQIDNALIKQGQILWVAIAAAPWRWADLGLQVRSELVFREAMCHLVGRWPRLTYQASKVEEMYPLGGAAALNADLDYTYTHGLPDPRDHQVIIDDERQRQELHVTPEEARRAHNIIGELRPEIRTLIQRKVAEIEHLKRATNMRLMGYYPGFFSRAGTGDGPARAQTVNEAIANLGSVIQNAAGINLPGLVLGANANADYRLAGLNVGPGGHTIRNTGVSVRATNYAKDILGWMAITLFRHWFGQYVIRLTSGHPQLDGGWSIYHSLGKGGDTYLNHVGVEAFCSWFPLSAKSRKEFEGVMTKIKEELKNYVSDVNRNRLTIDLEKAVGVVLRTGGRDDTTNSPGAGLPALEDPVEALFGKDSGIRVHKGRLEMRYLLCSEVTGLELPWKFEKKTARHSQDRNLMPPPPSSSLARIAGTRRKSHHEEDYERTENFPGSGGYEGSSSKGKKRIRFTDEELPGGAQDDDDFLEAPPRKRRTAISGPDYRIPPVRGISPEVDEEEIGIVSDEEIADMSPGEPHENVDEELMQAAGHAAQEKRMTGWLKKRRERGPTPESEEHSGGTSIFITPR